LSDTDPNQRALARLARAIHELREQREMTQRELAVAVGVHEARISALERGRLDPDYALLVALAQALGVSLLELVMRIEGLARGERE
jgi:transcriptional regulator with XRE-family HTH domain